MKFSLNLGALKSTLPPRAGGGKEVFRLAVLGDFSARASGGKLATGEQLAKRKPLPVDVDNFDDIVRRMDIKLTLPIGADGGAVEIPIGSMDDFHPDQLYDNVPVFASLASLRQRLKTTSTFAKAAAEVQGWLGAAAEEPQARPLARGNVVPVDGKLSDFAALVGQHSAKQGQTPIAELLKQIVGPHIVAAKDPQADKLVAAVDQAIGQTMRSILHHPDFQALESVWRGLEFLVRRLETGPNLRIVMYDISAEEFAADLSATEDLQETGLYQLLVEQPAQDAQQGPLTAIVTNYFLEQTPPHAELLGRMSRLCAAAQAPLLAAIGTEVIRKRKPEEIHPLIAESWGALRSLPEAGYIGLCVPRFLLRSPYGASSDPIDKFDFEEFTPAEGLKGMLYASGAVLAGLLLAQTFQKAGSLKKLSLGSVMGAGDMPYFCYEDADGDQVALPCTERLLSVDAAAHVTAQRFMPVLAVKGRPEARLGSFQSLAGKPLAGVWAPVTIAPPAAAPAVAEPAAAPPVVEEALALASASPVTDTPPAASAAADAELDDLLASLSAPAEPPAAAAGGSESAIDADLAALLADL
jgi:type VI secretion system protein ImpC